MFGDAIMGALNELQIANGGTLVSDSNMGAMFSQMQVDLSNDWLGPTQVASSKGGSLHALAYTDLQNGYYDAEGNYYAPTLQDNEMPISNMNVRTNEGQCAIQFIAQEEQGATGEGLTTWEARRQTWTSLMSAMGDEKDLQMSPINTAVTSGSSNIQQDNSTISNDSSTASAIVPIASIIANNIANV